MQGLEQARGEARWRQMHAQELESELDARRTRLSGNIDELSDRMTFGNLIAEGKEALWREFDRIVHDMASAGEAIVSDGMDWARDNRTLVAGGTLTALAAAGLVWYATRRKTVPLYAAYGMEDPDMMNETDETVAGKATAAWGKVKGEAGHLGDKAGEAYYSARSKAAELSEAARERAAEAADVAREKAREAAEAAREAADRAREAAGEAREWAVRQPQENPATVVLGALAAGILIGILLPKGGRNHG